MPVQLARALDVARSQIGYTEAYGNNTKYGRAYGMNGVAWCDIFQWWVFDQAGDDSSTGGKFAYTPAHADWFKSMNRWSTVPRLGDLVFYNLPGGPNRISHVGLVSRVNGPRDILAIEGNTNSYGSRTGGKVLEQHRTVGIVGFGRPFYTGPKPKPKGPEVELKAVKIKMPKDPTAIKEHQLKNTPRNQIVGRVTRLLPSPNAVDPVIKTVPGTDGKAKLLIPNDPGIASKEITLALWVQA